MAISKIQAIINAMDDSMRHKGLAIQLLDDLREALATSLDNDIQFKRRMVAAMSDNQPQTNVDLEHEMKELLNAQGHIPLATEERQ